MSGQIISYVENEKGMIEITMRTSKQKRNNSKQKTNDSKLKILKKISKIQNVSKKAKL